MFSGLGLASFCNRRRSFARDLWGAGGEGPLAPSTRPPPTLARVPPRQGPAASTPGPAWLRWEQVSGSTLRSLVGGPAPPLDPHPGGPPWPGRPPFPSGGTDEVRPQGLTALADVSRSLMRHGRSRTEGQGECGSLPGEVPRDTSAGQGLRTRTQLPAEVPGGTTRSRRGRLTQGRGTELSLCPLGSGLGGPVTNDRGAAGKEAEVDEQA